MLSEQALAKSVSDSVRVTEKMQQKSEPSLALAIRRAATAEVCGTLRCTSCETPECLACMTAEPKTHWWEFSAGKARSRPRRTACAVSDSFTVWSAFALSD